MIPQSCWIAQDQNSPGGFLHTPLPRTCGQMLCGRMEQPSRLKTMNLSKETSLSNSPRNKSMSLCPAPAREKYQIRDRWSICTTNPTNSLKLASQPGEFHLRAIAKRCSGKRCGSEWGMWPYSKGAPKIGLSCCWGASWSTSWTFGHCL